MKNKIYQKFLIISSVLLFCGCAMISPFKSVSSCKDLSGNEGACASAESNLDYSVSKDAPKETIVAVPHDETDVMKDEIVRLMAELSIDTNVTKKPTLIPSTTYRVLVLPYSSGEKFYSARYVYITAGKPRWVTGNYIVSENAPIKIETPVAKRKPIEVLPKEEKVPVVRKIVAKPEPIKHRVNAYLLNCRDTPSMEGNSIAVFEQDEVLDIIDKSLDWWEVSYYDIKCYVNPKYLYTEPVK